MFYERVPADAQRCSRIARQGNLGSTIVWGKIAACVAFITFIAAIFTTLLSLLGATFSLNPCLLLLPPPPFSACRLFITTTWRSPGNRRYCNTIIVYSRRVMHRRLPLNGRTMVRLIVSLPFSHISLFFKKTLSSTSSYIEHLPGQKLLLAIY